MRWLLAIVFTASYAHAQERPVQCILPDGGVTESSRHVLYGLPVPNKPGAAYTCLENTGYAVGYSESLKDPLWAAYKVWHVEKPSAFPRPQRFRVDKRTQARVKHEDYKQESHVYDRGHMAPSFTIGSRYGRDAQIETFFMSNVVPQRKELNEQTWRILEDLIASRWACKHKEVFVFVGPIFPKSPKRLNGVAAIPSSFYAIVVANEGGEFRSIALIVPQVVKGSRKLRSFVTDIDTIERKTGLDFFSELPDPIEKDVEKMRANDGWDVDTELRPGVVTDDIEGCKP